MTGGMNPREQQLRAAMSAQATRNQCRSMKRQPMTSSRHLHTHAEVPNPMPVGSKLWVEVESDEGEKLIVSFDLH